MSPTPNCVSHTTGDRAPNHELRGAETGRSIIHFATPRVINKDNALFSFVELRNPATAHPFYWAGFAVSDGRSPASA